MCLMSWRNNRRGMRLKEMQDLDLSLMDQMRD